MSNFTKQDLAKAVADTTGMSPKAAGEAVAAVFTHVAAAAQSGRAVTITGFGRFEMKERSARAGRNPATGETIQIAASRKLSFKASKTNA